MTALDLGTVLVLHKTSLLAGAGGLLLPWLGGGRPRGVGALAVGYLLLALGAFLAGLGEFGAISAETWRSSSLALGAFAYTLIYCGIRRLDRPAGRALWLFAASPVILAIGLLTPVFDDNTLRASAFHAVAALAGLASAISLIRGGRSERLASRAPLAFALGACGLVYGVQFPLIALGFSSPGSIAIGFAVTMMLNFSIAALVVSFVRERGEETERRRSVTDALTGVLNRHGFRDAVPDFVPEGAAMLLLDLDHFKSINDRFGHAGGDAVLTRLSRLVEACLRPGEILARLGGEEFVVFLPHGGSRSVELAETARARLADAVIDWRGERIAVSTSVGVALASPRRSEGREALLARADAALYRAKRLGRNRVEIDGVALSDGAGRPSASWQGVTPHFAPG